MKSNLLFFAAVIFVTAFSSCNPASKLTKTNLTDFPAGATPQEIGQRVAERFLEVPHPNFGRPTPPERISYPEVCAWYGALTFAKESGDIKLSDQLAARFEPLFG